MKKNLLSLVSTFVMLFVAQFALAETETRTVLDLDFSKGNGGCTIQGGAVSGGVLTVDAADGNYVETPEIDLSVSTDGVFKATVTFAMPAADASVSYVSAYLDKYYNDANGAEVKKNMGYPFLYNPAGPWAGYIPADGWQMTTFTDNISSQVCPSQKVRLRMYVPGGTTAFKLKSITVTCESEVKVEEEPVEEPEMVTLISEDFSKFTTPSPADLSDATTDMVPAKYTNQPGWKAHGVQALGGFARLQSSKDYIETPTFDFSANSEGKFTVKCKITNPNAGSYLFMYVKAKYVDASGNVKEVVGFDKPEGKDAYYVTVSKEENITKYFILSKEECPSQKASVYVEDYYKGSEFYIDDVNISCLGDNVAEKDQFEDNGQYAPIELNKAYQLTCKRGTWAYAGGKLTSTEVAGIATSGEDAKQQFVFVEKDSKLYIWNQDAQHFLNNAGKAVNILQASPVEFSKQSDGTLFFHFTDASGKYINMNNEKLVVIDGWSSADDGNKMSLVEVGEADVTLIKSVLEADAQIAVTTITWNVVDAEGNVVKSEVKANCLEGETVNTGISAAYVTLSGKTSVVAGKEDQTINLTYTVADDAPFKYSKSYNDATWYTLTIRSTKYPAYNESTGKFPNATSKPAETTLNNIFAFAGNPFNLVILNGALGEEQALGLVGDRYKGVALNEADKLSFENNSGHLVFARNANTVSHVNDVNGELGEWNNGASATDGGSSFTFEPVDEEIIKALFSQPVPEISYDVEEGAEVDLALQKSIHVSVALPAGMNAEDELYVEGMVYGKDGTQDPIFGYTNFENGVDVGISRYTANETYTIVISKIGYGEVIGYGEDGFTPIYKNTFEGQDDEALSSLNFFVKPVPAEPLNAEIAVEGTEIKVVFPEGTDMGDNYVVKPYIKQGESKIEVADYYIDNTTGGFFDPLNLIVISLNEELASGKYTLVLPAGMFIVNGGSDNVEMTSIFTVGADEEPAGEMAVIPSLFAGFEKTNSGVIGGIGIEYTLNGHSLVSADVAEGLRVQIENCPKAIGVSFSLNEMKMGQDAEGTFWTVGKELAVGEIEMHADSYASFDAPIPFYVGNKYQLTITVYGMVNGEPAEIGTYTYQFNGSADENGIATEAKPGNGETAIKGVSATVADGKYMKNGKIVIVKNGKTYTSAGQRMK